MPTLVGTTLPWRGQLGEWNLVKLKRVHYCVNL